MASILGFQKEIEERVKDARRSGSSSGKANRLPDGKASDSISGSGSGSISGSASAYFKENPIASHGSTKRAPGSMSSGELKDSSGSVKEVATIEDGEDSTEANLQVSPITETQSLVFICMTRRYSCFPMVKRRGTKPATFYPIS